MDLGCVGGDWKDVSDAIKPRVFAHLLAMAYLEVERFHTDFYQDARYILEALQPEITYFYSWDKDGTCFSDDPGEGLHRYIEDRMPVNGFAFFITKTDGKWSLEHMDPVEAREGLAE